MAYGAKRDDSSCAKARMCSPAQTAGSTACENSAGAPARRAVAPSSTVETNGVGAFWWSDGGLGYAVSGPADRPKLLEVAEAIHAQVAVR